MRGGRYKANGVETKFESESRGRGLQNLMGVRSLREMNRLEYAALVAVTDRLINEVTVNQRFSTEDICRMHRLWLENIYAWAGEYRQVNIGKDGFMFAAANQIARLMQEFERGPLRIFTPCQMTGTDEQAHALGVVHAELILIHPFREGNGRCSRLLAMLMALQAGLPALDFGGLQGKAKRDYIEAIHAAMGRDYEPITAVFRAVIKRTLRAVAR